MVTRQTNRLIIKARATRLVTPPTSLIHRVAIRMVLTVGVVVITTAALIAERQVRALILRLDKEAAAAAQRLHSSLIFHGPQHPVPEVADQLQKHPVRILQRRPLQPRQRLLMLMTILSVRRKTCESRTRGRKKTKKCLLLPSLLLPQHSRNPDLASR